MFFFQRIYDRLAVETRILDHAGKLEQTALTTIWRRSIQKPAPKAVAGNRFRCLQPEFPNCARQSRCSSRMRSTGESTLIARLANVRHRFTKAYSVLLSLSEIRKVSITAWNPQSHGTGDLSVPNPADGLAFRKSASLFWPIVQVLFQRNIEVEKLLAVYFEARHIDMSAGLGRVNSRDVEEEEAVVG
jgi:hypothetical protein